MRLLLAVSAVAVLLAILAPEFIPSFLADTGRVLEDLYLQLLLLPGAANASVTPTKTAGADLKQEQPEETRKNADTLLEEADVLRQKKATNEREIDAQQRVSAQRYAEARRAEPDMPDIVPLPLEHPDEIRQRMVVDRFGPEMRCGETLPPESRITTRSVELHAESIFQGSYGGQFAWKYVVTFSNHGEETVQMLTRHWVFVDALGRLETEVKGPGARGVTPVLPPGGQWVYESGTRLKTPHGTMHGSFQFEILKSSQRLDSRSFSARVGRLALSEDGRPKNVPCVSEAEEGQRGGASSRTGKRFFWLSGVVGLHPAESECPSSSRTMLTGHLTQRLSAPQLLPFLLDYYCYYCYYSYHHYYCHYRNRNHCHYP
ncbi:apaG [Symbiodinium sp. CCMP2592]|nr:apaG [Symbiodinium sp. CCMP2592]